MRKSDYAKLFTRRKDGVYQKYVNGKYLYSKDPEELYRKWQAVLNHEAPEISFKQAAESWEKLSREQISERTWNNYKPHYEDILSEFGAKNITDIDPQDIVNYLLRAKKQNFSATIIKTKKTILRQIFDKSITDGHLKYNPVTNIKTPKGSSSRRRAPTDAELQTVFSNLDRPFGFFPFFLICTGLRKSEALALTKDDIDLKARQISVTKSLVYIDNANPSVKPPKTDAGVRVVPIPEILMGPLEARMKELSGNIIFPNPKSNRNPGGGYMTEKAYEVAWDNYCKETGLTLTAHQLRHGSATIMFESGVDMYSAQKILGHANINTTMQIYTELREAQFQKSITSLNRGLSKYAKGEKI